MNTSSKIISLTAILASFLLALAPAQADTMYVTNERDNTILKIDASGNASVFANSGLSAPEGLAFDSSGTLYVANQHDRTHASANRARERLAGNVWRCLRAFPHAPDLLPAAQWPAMRWHLWPCGDSKLLQ